jgi:16S rRNA (cytosine1402-N4)-methyltransferase
LIAFDVDHTAQVYADALARQDPRFTFVLRPFAEVAEVMRGTVVNGVMLDVGVSSPQLDDYSRGFSLQNLGRSAGPRPFDLRMNAKGGVSASDWLKGVTVEELAWVFREFIGRTRSMDSTVDEHLFAERLAQLVIDEQEARGPYKTIDRFAEVVGKAVMVARGDLKESEEFEHPRRGLDHPSRTFVQAIRTFLNDEVLQLQEVIPEALECLAVGGRLLIAVFKPGESNVVKEFCLNHQEPAPSEAARLTPRRLRELYPLAGTSRGWSCQVVVRGLKPSGYEVSSNFRARSGSLWVLEKAARTLRHVKTKPRLAKNRFKRPPRPILADGLPDCPDLKPA